MLEQKPQTEGMSIALLGSFNPKIFQPHWLSSQGLIPKEEADSAEVSVIHPDISSFKINKINFQIVQDRFFVSTSFEPSFKILKDLVVGVFDLLHFTPIHSLGMNRDFHFSMESKDDWHAFGDKLTPKGPWADILKKPGMRSLMIEGQRPDDYIGYIRVKAEPSSRVSPYGVFVNINDHYQIPDQESAEGSEQIIDIIRNQWESSLARSWEIAQKLLVAK